jgi:alkylation response protein AidB-like acyl-CoA dehydrogenase
MTATAEQQSAELTKTLRAARQHDDRKRIAGALDLLHRNRCLSIRFIKSATTAAELNPPVLFEVLKAIGRGDLSVARLYEGHVNALQLVARLGSPSQFDRIANSANEGQLLGVWGADDPASPGRLLKNNGGYQLSGNKTFASGADLVWHAIVAVKTPEARTQLLLLSREAFVGRLDAEWWKPLGMQATNSF